MMVEFLMSGWNQITFYAFLCQIDLHHNASVKSFLMLKDNNFKALFTSAFISTIDKGISVLQTEEVSQFF